MRKKCFVGILAMVLSFAAPAWAGGDAILLENGQRLEGDIVFWNDTEFILSVKGELKEIPISGIRQIEFGPKPGVPSRKLIRTAPASG